MIKDDEFKGRWTSVVERDKDLLFYICQIVDHSEKDILGILLGNIKNVLSYGLDGKKWEFLEKDDLSEWVFPVKLNQIYKTKQEAERALIGDLLDS